MAMTARGSLWIACALLSALAAMTGMGCSCGIESGKLDSIRCDDERDCLLDEVCAGGYCQLDGAGDGDADGDSDGDADGDADADGGAPCPGSEVLCGGDCFDLSTDHEHCGRCDRSCGGGETCVAGQCEQADCDPGLVFCEGAGACVDLSTDADNCGRCGRSCGAGAACDAGNCGGCAEGFVACPGAGCADLSSDPNHCGGCETVCPAGSDCNSGQCSCPAGQTDCNAGAGVDCRDLDADPTSCGGCGVTCAADEFCDAGGCACRPGLTAECGGGCVSLATDPANCGACGAPCGDLCQGGHCVADCNGDGMRQCDGGYCTNSRTDPLNCGDCNNVCAVDELCIEGNCQQFAPALGCDACPCDACGGNFARCCTYPGGALPVCVDAERCPAN